MDDTSTILVVEDEPDERDILSMQLEAQGYQVVLAANGLEALEKARESIPDLILLDVMLPGLDGFGVCRMLRASSLLAEVPVLMVTALGDRHSRLQGIESGADDFISKPLDLAELLARVRTTTRLNRYRKLLSERLKLEKAEAALEESQARYRAVSELTSDFAYAIRVETQDNLALEWTMGAITHITGFTLPEIEARGGWTSLIHPDDQPLLLDIKRKVLSGQPHTDEIRIVAKNGEARWLRAYNRPEWDSTGKRVARIYGACQDITERKRMEQRIAATYQIGRAVSASLDMNQIFLEIVKGLESMLVFDRASLWLLDAQDRFFVVSLKSPDAGEPITTKLGGLSADDVVIERRPAQDPGAPPLAEGHTLSARLEARGRSIGWMVLACNEPHQYTDSDQDLLDQLSPHISIAIENARLYTQVCQAAETLEAQVAARTKELQAALRRAEEVDRLKSQLLSTVSHELRTPLTSIRGQTSTLLDYADQISREERMETLRIIDDEAARLDELIGHLLDMSRLESGALRVDVVATDLLPILQEALACTSAQFPTHRLETVAPAQLPLVLADPRRVMQVITNLLNNAAKFSAPGAAITLEIETRPACLVVHVRDQGVGIAAEHLPRIFDRFYRVAENGLRASGAGLGLAICKGLVEAMGGQIQATSQAGQGSVFSFSLPLAQRMNA